MTTATPTFLFVDLFAGAGGTTTGAEQSGVCRVLAAVNHDPVAISSHSANHPHVEHFVEDIRTLDTSELVRIVSRARARHPHAKLVLWGSPDCTHFSRAKSGPKNRDTRSLADEMPRYARALQPDYIKVENVEEFTSWGPLDDAGRPISRHEGRDYMRWVQSITSLGYHYQYRILNAADYGAHTSRRRYFGVFAKQGLPIVWPEPTHAKAPGRGGLFADHRQPWRPVMEVLDLHDIGRSIFDREKPLVDKTLRRILNGLRKFIGQPLLMTCNTPGYSLPLDRPSGAITAAGHKALVTPMLITYYNHGGSVQVTGSAPTVTAKDRMGIVTPVQWIDKNYSSAISGNPIDQPAGSVLPSPKSALCTAWLLNPQYNNPGNPIDQPSPTVIARQKSYPLSLAIATAEMPGPSAPLPSGEGPGVGSGVGSPRWLPATADTPTMLELKAFMRRHQVADIYLRMLHERELARIQGFPDDYVLHGTSEHRKKQIGNAVVSHIPKAMLRALAAALNPTV